MSGQGGCTSPGCWVVQNGLVTATAILAVLTANLATATGDRFAGAGARGVPGTAISHLVDATLAWGTTFLDPPAPPSSDVLGLEVNLPDDGWDELILDGSGHRVPLDTGQPAGRHQTDHQLARGPPALSWLPEVPI